MTRFVEGSLSFEFSADWAVEKWDETPFYRRRHQRLCGELDGKGEGTKALDFVGVHRGQELWLIEVKDFRRHPIESGPRMESAELALEVGLKVRDSLSGLVGARQMDVDAKLWSSAVQLMPLTSPNPIRVVLWMETDGPLTQREKQRRSVLLNRLKSMLRWLTTYVSVACIEDNSLPDVEVWSLPLI